MKKLIFRDREFYADKFVKNEKSIIFYIGDIEINRLQPICTNETYTVYNQDGTVGEFDKYELQQEAITTATDMMKLLYVVMKELNNVESQITAINNKIGV